MKKLTIFMFIAALAASTAFAQPIKEQREAELRNQQERPNRERTPRQNGQMPQQNRQQKDNSVSVEGTLKLEKGFVAVQSGESVYLVPMLNRYIGFIGGLKEGEKVSVEGRSFRNMIQPLKVTLGEKSYDFMAPPRGTNFNHYNDKHGKFDKRDKHHNHHFDKKNKFDHGKKDRPNRGGSR